MTTPPSHATRTGEHMQQNNDTAGNERRDQLRERLDQLILRLRNGDVEAVRDSMYNRRWREGADVARVDSGQLAYADNLVDEAHSILRRAPGDTAAAIEKLEQGRAKFA